MKRGEARLNKRKRDKRRRKTKRAGNGGRRAEKQRLEAEIRGNKWNGEEWRKSMERGKSGMKEET